MASSLTLVDGTKPYKVRTSCGHIVIRRMREATAGVPFTPDTIIEAPGGRPCEECETFPKRPDHLVRVAVPRLNKNEHIADYLKQLPTRDYDLNWAEVTETKHFNCAEWNELMQHLLDDREWLAGKGGARSWAFTDESDDRDFFQLSEPERELWKKTCYLLVIAAVAPSGQTVYIDPQGYNYARYVAFPAHDPPEGKTHEQLRAERAQARETERVANLVKRIENPPAVPDDHGLRFLWNGFKVNGGKLVKAYYSIGKLIHYPDGTITVYGRDYEHFPKEVTRFFHIENETDSQSDYFEDDKFRVCPNHPLYGLIKAALDAQEEHNRKRMEKLNMRLSR
jgi:hypothetical protein